MRRSTAIEVKQLTLDAVASINRALNSAEEGYSPEEMECLHRTAGLLIGRIQMEILEPIYQTFPDLDDLK
jgi:hypothetical protein